MTYWHDTIIDGSETDDAVFAAGWTISGLALLGMILAAWVISF